jgi:hypothetical protein
MLQEHTLDFFVSIKKNAAKRPLSYQETENRQLKKNHLVIYCAKCCMIRLGLRCMGHGPNARMFPIYIILSCPARRKNFA